MSLNACHEWAQRLQPLLDHIPTPSAAFLLCTNASQQVGVVRIDTAVFPVSSRILHKQVQINTITQWRHRVAQALGDAACPDCRPRERYTLRWHQRMMLVYDETSIVSIGQTPNSVLIFADIDSDSPQALRELAACLPFPSSSPIMLPGPDASAHARLGLRLQGLQSPLERLWDLWGKQSVHSLGPRWRDTRLFPTKLGWAVFRGQSLVAFVPIQR